jgi:predicted phosphodiesterase
MKILVISDIHANLTALEAVLASAGEVDATWCLGDLVGYGPDPNECVERVRKMPRLTCVRGNHDEAVINSKNIDKFNDDAERSIRFTVDRLTADNLAFLKKQREKIITQTVTLAHGSPRSPMWEYLVEPFVALMNFAHFNTQLAFVGHSHLPISFHMEAHGDKVIRTNAEGNLELPRAGDPQPRLGRTTARQGPARFLRHIRSRRIHLACLPCGIRHPSCTAAHLRGRSSGKGSPAPGGRLVEGNFLF